MSQLGAPLPHPPALMLAPPLSNEEPVSINSITSSFVCDEDVLVDVAALFSPYDPTLAVSSEEITTAFLALSAGLSERDSDVHVPSELLATIWLYARAGSLSTWGSSRHGVLAHGDDQDRCEPATVNFTRAVLSVAAGNDHMLIQCLDGIYAVGRGAYGQLGMGDMRGDLRAPERIRDLDGLTVLQVACGYWHSLFCTTTGVYVCGWNNHGQLGLGDNTRQQGTPALVDFKGQVPTAVAGGAFHSLFLIGGSVYSCGVGTSGELGLGDKVDHRTPVLLTAFKGKKVLNISAGGHRSFVQCTDGIYAFGDNYCGTLGVGDEEPRVVPVKIPAFNDLATRVTCISSRGGRTSVVVQGVGLFSFGNAENGKLGLGDNTNKSSPVLVPALADSDVQQTACGYDHSITVCERYVVACGLNKHGELGVSADAQLEGETLPEDDTVIVMPGTGTGVLTPPPVVQAAPAALVALAPTAVGMGPGVVMLPAGGIPVTPQLPPAGEPIKPDVYASTPLPVVGLQHSDVLSCAAGDGFSAAVVVPRAAPAGMVFATKPHYAMPFETRTK